MTQTKKTVRCRRWRRNTFQRVINKPVYEYRVTTQWPMKGQVFRRRKNGCTVRRMGRWFMAWVSNHRLMRSCNRGLEKQEAWKHSRNTRTHRYATTKRPPKVYILEHKPENTRERRNWLIVFSRYKPDGKNEVRWAFELIEKISPGTLDHLEQSDPGFRSSMELLTCKLIEDFYPGMASRKAGL